MTPANLSVLWKDLAPALGNHLWQSTLFAVAAGLLTLLLRKNHARARYWLWLAASVKFLIPFSLLVGLGSRLAWSHRSPAATGGLYVVVEQISQPFTQTAIAMPTISPSTSTVTSQSLFHMLPVLLVAVWLCGFSLVVLIWCMRWRKISIALRNAEPLQEGREAEALRKLQRIAGTRTPIDLVLSRTSLEPGIFGITRPVLVWPEGISKHLEDAHLEAILAHELWHVRRRDNLAAAIHMFVEAMFWFHPLVWWLGARLVEERERACDEEVVELGGERHVYAESILKVCEFCVGSPLACVSGVTGSDLKKRMVHIMTEQIVRKLEFGKKVLLSAAAMLAIALPLVFGLVNATPTRAQADEEASTSIPKYTASIKPTSLPTEVHGGSVKHMEQIMFSPNGFFAANISLEKIIQEAYGVQANQIVGGPDWLKSTAYDVEVKINNSEASKPETDNPELGPSTKQSRQVLRSILAERFKLAVHNETKNLSSYVLVVAEDGSKLQPSQATDSTFHAEAPRSMLMGSSMRMKVDDGQARALEARGIPTAAFASLLSRQLGKVVVDKTALPGKYDFTLKWTAEPSATPENSTESADAAGDSSSPLFAAIHDQLGLKLEPQKAPLSVLVIDHAERLAESAQN
jgi:bla regulator protein BlaR1